MTLTTRQVLDVLTRAELPLDHERLKSWHRRGIAPGEPEGKGRMRNYSLEDVAFLASLVLVTKRASQLDESESALLEACQPAAILAESVLEFYRGGLDGNRAQQMPMVVLVNDFNGPLAFEEYGPEQMRRLKPHYATRGAMLLHVGFFAMALFKAINDEMPGCLATQAPTTRP